MNNLSIDLRPRELSEVVGHESVKAAIQKQIESGAIPRAFMFSGPAGLGKTTLANIVARMIQKDVAEDEPLDVTELNSADTNGVDDIRQLISQCAYRPFNGSRKVLILNECQMLTVQAQNVLLAPFEAEDSSTVFILTTTDPAKIIQPLQDRCKHFRLKPLSKDVEFHDLIERASAHLNVPYPSPEADAFIETAMAARIGSPRVLLQSFEKLVSGIPLKDCFTSDTHEPMYRDVAASVVRGDWNTCRNLLSQIPTADSRALRSIVSGFLRSALLKCESGPKGAAIANCVVGLGSASFEDGLAYSATCGLFFKTCAAISQAGK